MKKYFISIVLIGLVVIISGYCYHRGEAIVSADLTGNAIKGIFSRDLKSNFSFSTDPYEPLRMYAAKNYGVKNLSSLTTITGDLVTVHLNSTDRQQGTAVERYLRDEKTKEYYKVQDVEESQDLLPIMRVSLTGLVVPNTGIRTGASLVPGNKILITRADQFSPEFDLSNLKKAKDYLTQKPFVGKIPWKALVVLVDMRPEASASVLPTPETVQGMISPGKIRDYYLEQSYGKLDYRADVTKWIKVPTGSPASFFGQTPTFFDQYASANNINLSNYDQIVYVVVGGTNHPNYSGLGTIGKSSYQNGSGNVFTIGQTMVYSNMPEPGATTGYSSFILQSSQNIFNNFQNVYIHETGHSLGVNHDNGYKCSSPTLIIDLPSKCQATEYDNSYSIMGTGSRTAHFTGLLKSQLGWISGTNQLWARNSGIYTIPALETNQAKVLFIDFDNNGSPEYIVDRRKPVGFDIPSVNAPGGAANLEGVFVYRPYQLTYAGTFDFRWIKSRLMDMSKPVGQVNGTDDVVLTDGKTFYDPALGVELTAQKLPTGEFQVSVVKHPTSCQTFPPALRSQYNAYGPVNVQTGILSRSTANQNGDVTIPIKSTFSSDDYPSCYSTAGLTLSLSLDGQPYQSVPNVNYMVGPFAEVSYNNTMSPVINVNTLANGSHVFTVQVVNQVTGLSSTVDLPFTLVP